MHGARTTPHHHGALTRPSRCIVDLCIGQRAVLSLEFGDHLAERSETPIVLGLTAQGFADPRAERFRPSRRDRGQPGRDEVGIDGRR